MSLIKDFLKKQYDTKQNFHLLVKDNKTTEAVKLLTDYINEYNSFKNIIARICVFFNTCYKKIKSFIAYIKSLIWRFWNFSVMKLFKGYTTTVYWEFGTYGIAKLLYKPFLKFLKEAKLFFEESEISVYNTYKEALEDIILYHENEKEFSKKHNILELYNDYMKALDNYKHKSDRFPSDRFLDSLEISDKFKKMFELGYTITVLDSDSVKVDKIGKKYEKACQKVLDNATKTLENMIKNRNNLWV